MSAADFTATERRERVNRAGRLAAEANETRTADAFRYRHLFPSGATGPWHYMETNPLDEFKADDLKAMVEVQRLIALPEASEVTP